MVEAEVCKARSKALEERIALSERRSDERDEENEKITSSVVTSMEKGFEGFRMDQDKIKKELKDLSKSTDDNFTALRKEIPLMVTSALDSSIKKGVGRAVIFFFKALLVGGVVGGMVAAISYLVQTFILGGVT